MSIELLVVLITLFVAHLIQYGYIIMSRLELQRVVKLQDMKIVQLLEDCTKMDQKMQAVYNRELDRMQVKLKEKEKEKA